MSYDSVDVSLATLEQALRPCKMLMISIRTEKFVERKCALRMLNGRQLYHCW
jgi:hypothetical protein